MGKKRSPGATRKAGSQRPRRRPHAMGRDDSSGRPPVVRALAHHRRGFVTWAEHETVHGRDIDGALLFDAAELLLSVTGPPAGLVDPARCTARQVSAVLMELEEDEWPAAEAAAVLDAFGHLLEYFEARHLWRGSTEDLFACRDLLAGATGAGLAASRLAQVTVDPETEARATASLPLVERAAALLHWVRAGRGGGRPVTATGALRRSDLLEASALVGEQLRTTSASPAGDQLTLEWLPPYPDAPATTVRGMWDVPALALVWQAGVVARALDVASTRAGLGEYGRKLLDGGPDHRRDARAVLVTGYLVVLFARTGRTPWWGPRGQATAHGLLALLLDGPAPYGRLEHEVPGLALAGPGDLERLLDLGILSREGDDLAVPPGLERLVAVALRLFLFDDDDYDEDGPGDDGLDEDG